MNPKMKKRLKKALYITLTILLIGFLIPQSIERHITKLTEYQQHTTQFKPQLRLCMFCIS